MAREFRIYPGIGIARLGNSPDDFFLAPEVPDVGPIELAADGIIQPVKQYKDANHKLRRQAARFRIYEVTAAPGGGETLTEVTAGNGVQIEWHVELANEKAAAGWFVSQTQPEDTGNPRNPGVSQTDLIIKPTFQPISSANQTVKASVEGKFKGTSVYLGELRTDDKGRLMVLGGRGMSASVPAGQPLGDGTQAHGHPANDFANNWAWFDDVSDGPVTAVVRIAGQPDQPVSQSAWLIVAPPDFAPYTNGITTLYDIAVQAANIPPPASPSFQNDVLPILRAASGLQWVSALLNWSSISTDYATLSDKNAAGATQLRSDTLTLLLDIERNGTLHDYNFTNNQKAVLNAWKNGNFVNDFQPSPPVQSLTPDGLNRASLTQAVGGGFFPGIEAGIRMTAPQMYSSPFRITNTPFVFAGVQQVPHAGFITRTMACPWQSDFFECAMQSDLSAWWPSQRPIEVFIDQAATNQERWIDSIPNHQVLVDKFWMLGLVEKPASGAASALIEAERDPSVPHPSAQG
jgi:L-Lysine epsilon oxidase N-terminal/L-lysine epsilon oxidase C-terminal domain